MEPDGVETQDSLIGAAIKSDETEEPEPSFPFHKLSAEIRNMIYDLVLVDNDNHSVVITKMNDNDANIMADDPDYRLRLKSRTGSYERLTQSDHYDQVMNIATSLLFLHPDLVEEVRSVILARNRFVFTSPFVLYHFLVQIGMARRFLQDVRIMDRDHLWTNGTVMQMAMGMLIQASTLRHLHLEISFCTPPIDHEDYHCDEIREIKRERLAELLVASMSHLLYATCVRREILIEDFLSLSPDNFCCHSHCGFPLSKFVDWPLEDDEDFFTECHTISSYKEDQSKLLAKVKTLLDANCPNPVGQRAAWK